MRPFDKRRRDKDDDNAEKRKESVVARRGSKKSWMMRKPVKRKGKRNRWEGLVPAESRSSSQLSTQEPLVISAFLRKTSRHRLRRCRVI